MSPVVAMRLDSSDAGNDPANTSSRHAFDLLAKGFGAGFNGPLLLVAELSGPGHAAALPALRAALSATPGVVAVTQPRIAPSGAVAVIQAYPDSAPQATATTNLVNRLRDRVLPALEHRTGMTVLVGGFTAASIDFSHVLGSKLPLFFAIVILLSALLLFVIFRSLVIPVQAAIMNLLTIGAALGVTVVVFQQGWFASVLGVQKGPIEAWVPVIMFAVVFGLSMDYEVFLVSRVREQWVRNGDASAAVADGISLTGRVISAAAAIMVCVFLSFTLGNERTLKEFGFGLAVAVFLDALVVRCVLLPAVLELLGPITWRLPRWLDALTTPRQHRGLDRARAARDRTPRRRRGARARSDAHTRLRAIYHTPGLHSNRSARVRSGLRGRRSADHNRSPQSMTGGADLSPGTSKRGRPDVEIATKQTHVGRRKANPGHAGSPAAAAVGREPSSGACIVSAAPTGPPTFQVRTLSRPNEKARR